MEGCISSSPKMTTDYPRCSFASALNVRPLLERTALFPSMSADTRPIRPGQFAAALTELSVPMLRLKHHEIQNSIAHLQYSNDELKPFAEGLRTTPGAASEPDQDCLDAIKENEVVIDRMIERIALIRAECEHRGVSWTTEQEKDQRESRPVELVNGHGSGRQSSHDAHPAWTDGTFQVGTIRNGVARVNTQTQRTTAAALAPRGELE